MKTITRTIHPEIRVLDEKTGVVEYLASDESIDSYREVIKADGWKHDMMRGKANPFIDSHQYDTILRQVGSVIDFGVRKKQLFNTAKWAIDVEENQLARFGFNMTKAGYLKPVSVGFKPVRSVSRYSTGDNYAAFEKELSKLKLDEGTEQPQKIYLEQQQVELSVVILGANPNALVQMTAKAYKADVIGDETIAWLSGLQFNFAPRNETDARAQHAAAALVSSRRAFLNAFDKQIEKIRKLRQ